MCRHHSPFPMLHMRPSFAHVCLAPFLLSLLLLMPSPSSCLTILGDVVLEANYGFPLVASLWSQTVSNLSFSLPLLDSSTATSAFLSQQLDFAIICAPLSPQQAAASPNVTVLPIFSSAIVPVYRLDVLDPAVTLVLSRLTLALIYAGQVRWWNDSAIQQDNPGVRFPNQSITVAYQNDSRWLNHVFTTALNKFYPPIAAVLPPSSLPAWPVQLYADSRAGLGPTGVVAIALDVDGVVGYCTEQTALVANANVAAMVNYAGQLVVPSQLTLTAALFELLTTPTTLPTAFPDMTDSHSASGWPIVITSWLLLDSAASPRGCEVRSTVAEFWLWFFTSSDITTRILDDYTLVQTPPLLLPYFDVVPALTSLTCNGSPIIAAASDFTPTSSSPSSYPILGPYRLTQTLNALIDFHTIVDANVDFSFTASDAVSSMQQGQTTYELAMFFTQEVATEARERNETDVQVRYDDWWVLPTLLTSTVLIYNPQLSASVTLNSSVQLVLDVPTVFAIITGQVSDWHDARLVALNPVLSSVLGAAPAPLTLVVACPSASGGEFPLFTQINLMILSYAEQFDPSLLLELGTLSTNSTIIAQFLQCDSFIPTWQFVDHESTIPSLVLNKPGAVGYASDTNRESIAEFDILYPLVTTASAADGQATGGEGLTSTVRRRSQPDGVRSCVTAMDPVTLALTLDPSASADCWPLTDVLYTQVAKDYPASESEAGLKDLQLLQWLLTSTVISPWCEDNMVLQVGALPALQAPLISALNSITSGGDTLLITLPVVWSVSPTIQTGGYVLTTIGWLCTLCALAFIARYRHHAIYRSASPTFIAISLLGVLELFASIIIGLQAQPSDHICCALNWTIQLGFSLLFGPIFLKAYRIYRIFGGRKLQVVKISNARLLRVLAAILAGDMLYQIVWVIVAPLSAVVTTVLEGDQHWHQYRQCSISSPSTLRFFIAAAVVKVAWLVLGALLAFSTRQVHDTFNESKSVALAIYNVVFSLGLIIPLILFIDARGDTLSMLLTFCLLWITFFSLAILFLPKLVEWMASTRRASDLSTVHPTAGGGAATDPSTPTLGAQLFSFFSLTQLSSASMAVHYLQALERHVVEARLHVAVMKAVQQPRKLTLHGSRVGGAGVESRVGLGGWGGVGGGGGGMSGRQSRGESVEGRSWKEDSNGGTAGAVPMALLSPPFSSDREGGGGGLGKQLPPLPSRTPRSESPLTPTVSAVDQRATPSP